MSEVAYHTAPYGTKTAARIIFFAVSHFDNLNKLRKAQGKIFIAQGIYDTIMKEEHHGKHLQKATLYKQHVTYRRVDSAHQHGNKVWFESGEDRRAVEQFLKG